MIRSVEIVTYILNSIYIPTGITRGDAEQPRTRLTQQARKAKTREAIVAAATRRFALRGVEATSLDDVAEAAGFTKGAIYANFPSKRALVEAVIERSIVQIDPALLVRPDLSLADRLALSAAKWRS